MGTCWARVSWWVRTIGGRLSAGGWRAGGGALCPCAARRLCRDVPRQGPGGGRGRDRGVPRRPQRLLVAPLPAAPAPRLQRPAHPTPHGTIDGNAAASERGRCSVGGV